MKPSPTKPCVVVLGLVLVTAAACSHRAPAQPDDAAATEQQASLDLADDLVTPPPDQASPALGPDAFVPKDCDPMEANGTGLCLEEFGWRWSGKTCNGEGGCWCKGKHCDLLYQTKLACLKAFAKCYCVPMDAQGLGTCGLFLGYKWDGKACVGISGCSCQGKDCLSLYHAKHEHTCKEERSVCP